MITAVRELVVMSKEVISFKGDKGEGVEYTEVIARDGGAIVVLRARDADKLIDFEPGETVDAEVADDGPANLRVRKYRLANG